MKFTLLLPIVAVGLLGACASKPVPGSIRAQYVAEGVTEVVLRASDAENVTVTNKGRDDLVTVKGMVSGGVGDYRSRDREWQASSAAQWGLDFASRQYGSTLVISTANEIAHEQYRYTIEDLEIDLPPTVRFVPQRRSLTVNGAPDLSAP